MRAVELTLQHDLDVHERGLHSSFLNDSLLSQPMKALCAPKFQNLYVYFPICYVHKINKTAPSLGGINKTKIVQ